MNCKRSPPGALTPCTAPIRLSFNHPPTLRRDQCNRAQSLIARDRELRTRALQREWLGLKPRRAARANRLCWEAFGYLGWTRGLGRITLIRMEPSSQVLLEAAFPVLRKQWSRFQVRRAWLFGSRATKGMTTGSDWDFLVEFSQPPDFDAFMGLKAGLEENLKGRVDILSRSACTPRFLNAIEADLIDVT